MSSSSGSGGGATANAKKFFIDVPSEAEAFALNVGTAMHWALRRSSNNPSFFKLVASEVKRTEATAQDWDHDEMVRLFHNKTLCGIGQGGFKTYLQREYGRKQVTHVVVRFNQLSYI